MADESNKAGTIMNSIADYFSADQKKKKAPPKPISEDPAYKEKAIGAIKGAFGS